MATNFSADDTDVYVETEKEFSMQDDINALLEWKRKNTTKAINLNQKGLIPYLADIRWEKNTTYFENGSYQILRNYFKIGLSVEGIPNNKLFNSKDIIYYNENIASAVSKNLIEPFLLFVNKIHIAWSKITIVRSDDKMSLLISDMDYDTVISDVKVIILPENTVYTEDEDQDPSLNLLFKFGDNGGYNQNNNIFVYSTDPYLRCNTYGESSYKNYNMSLPYNRKITADNLVIFDAAGQIEDKSTIDIDIKNTNLITLDTASNKFRYIVCCYNLKNNLNEANMMRAINIPFEKALVSGTTGFEDLNYDMFLSDFSFDHTKTLPYATNIANSLNYVFGYDENKMDEVFMKIRPVNIMEFDPNDLLLRYMADGDINMLRDFYPGNKSDTFPIIFHNGMIPSYYDKIEYTPTAFKFQPYSDMYGVAGFSYKDKFEVAFCRNIRNDLIKLDLSKNADADYLDMGNFFFPKEDIVVYSACRGEINLFPINYTISGTKIVLKNSAYLEAQLYIGSRNQFIYERYSISASATNTIDLSTKFRTGYDGKKYMVFVNGRYINSIFYRILIPSMNNGKISKRSIYMMKTVGAGDRVDVFYCATPKMNRVNFNGDLVIHCIKTKAIADGQSRFKVPYPYKNYPREYNSFFCIRHASYVDKNKYNIDRDYIQFIDGENCLSFGEDLIFVFPYYRPSWENDKEIDPNSIGNFVTRTVTTVNDTNTVNFNNTGDSLGNIETSSKDTIYLFFNSTYIDPSRFIVSAANQIKMVDETIPADTIVTVAIEADDTTLITSDIALDTVRVFATETKQYLFDIPEEAYYDSFYLIRGSVLVEPIRYFITTENKLMFVNEDDYVDNGDCIIFVFARDKNEDLNADYTMHIKTEFMHCECDKDTKIVHIPTNYYHRFKFSKENIVLFASSSYIDPSRYSVNGNNEITMADPDDIIFNEKNVITMMIVYKTLNYKRVDGEIQNREIIHFQDEFTEVVVDGQKLIPVPYPFVFTDTEFLLSKGSSIIGPSQYSLTLDRKYINYNDDSLVAGDVIRFTFVHNGGFTHISKKQIAVTLAPNQTEVNIPAPYAKFVDLNNRMIITYGNIYVDKDRYTVDNQAKRVILYDIPNTGDNGRDLVFTFFFTGSEYNGAMAYLPQSGYVCFLRKDITHNFNKDMYMMFVNGRKVAKSELLDISNNLVKVCIDINRTYDLIVLDCAPTVTELKDRYGTMSTWTNMLDPLPI